MDIESPRPERLVLRQYSAHLPPDFPDNPTISY
jgi:hypothetical protein